MIFEGMKIKTYPDTDVEAYLRWIRDEGYNVSFRNSQIIVGEKRRRENDLKDFSKIIRNCRTKSGLSREAFANKVGVTPETLFEWERGHRLPSKSHQRILKILIEGEQLCYIGPER